MCCQGGLVLTLDSLGQFGFKDKVTEVCSLDFALIFNTHQKMALHQIKARQLSDALTFFPRENASKLSHNDERLGRLVDLGCYGRDP